MVDIPRLPEINREFAVVDDAVSEEGNEAPQPNGLPSDSEDEPSAASQISPQDSQISTNTSDGTSLMSTTNSPGRPIIRLRLCACEDGAGYSDNAEICSECNDICNNVACRGHCYNGPFVRQLAGQPGCDYDLEDNSWVWLQICHCPTRSVRGQYCGECQGYPLLHELVLLLKNKHGAEIRPRKGEHRAVSLY